MLWGLKELKRREKSTGPVQVSKAELFLLCGEIEGVTTVFTEYVSDNIRDALNVEGLKAYIIHSD